MNFDIEEATLLQMKEALDAGQITSLWLVDQYLERIEAYDTKGANLRAFITVNPNAREVAKELDRKRTTADPGPLYGIPVLLKDNIDTMDPMPTTAGSVALKDNFQKKDAFLVRQLRKVGAIILGKSTMSEFANFLTEGLPNGYSGLGGQAKNPYAPAVFDVGGSSSGIGTGIAANLAAVGIGTETDGSILSPSSSNALVGIKPTTGLVSGSGIIPLSPSQDTAGPMARTVEDAVHMLAVIAGMEEQDTATDEANATSENYVEALRKDGLHGKRLGVDSDLLEELSDEQAAVINKAITVAKDAGAIVVEEINIVKSNHESSVFFYEMKKHLNAYLETTPDSVKSRTLEEIISFNKKYPQHIPYGQTYLEASQLADDKEKYEKDRATDLSMSGEKGLDLAFQEHELDAIITAGHYGSTLPARAGYPSITVPAGYTSDGEPIGITFTGRAFSEEGLIEITYAFEQATKHRKAPDLSVASSDNVRRLQELVQEARGNRDAEKALDIAERVLEQTEAKTSIMLALKALEKALTK